MKENIFCDENINIQYYLDIYGRCTYSGIIKMYINERKCCLFAFALSECAATKTQIKLPFITLYVYIYITIDMFPFMHFSFFSSFSSFPFAYIHAQVHYGLDMDQ